MEIEGVRATRLFNPFFIISRKTYFFFGNSHNMWIFLAQNEKAMLGNIDFKSTSIIDE